MRLGFATVAYTVTRRAAGTYVKGRLVPAVGTTTISIVADVQPVQGRKLEDLPEGQRGGEHLLVITATELRARQPGNEGDVVTIGGEPWRVVEVEAWRAFGPPHYECIVARETKSA